MGRGQGASARQGEARRRRHSRRRRASAAPERRNGGNRRRATRTTGATETKANLKAWQSADGERKRSERERSACVANSAGAFFLWRHAPPRLDAEGGTQHLGAQRKKRAGNGEPRSAASLTAAAKPRERGGHGYQKERERSDTENTTGAARAPTPHQAKRNNKAATTPFARGGAANPDPTRNRAHSQGAREARAAAFFGRFPFAAEITTTR